MPARCRASQCARLRISITVSLDAAQGEQVGQEQAGWPCADDADLSTFLDGHAGATT